MRHLSVFLIERTEVVVSALLFLFPSQNEGLEQGSRGHFATSQNAQSSGVER